MLAADIDLVFVFFHLIFVGISEQKVKRHLHTP